MGSSTNPVVCRMSRSYPASASCRHASDVRRHCPHDCVGHRFTGLTIPYDGGLALIRKAYAGDVGEVEPCALHRSTGRGDRRVGNGVRVVFYPTRFGIALFEIDLRRRYRLSVTVEDDGACAGSALVQGQDMDGGCQ